MAYGPWGEMLGVVRVLGELLESQLWALETLCTWLCTPLGELASVIMDWS